MKVENFTETSEINELFDLFTYNKVKINYLSPVVLYSCRKLHKMDSEDHGLLCYYSTLIQITLIIFNR